MAKPWGHELLLTPPGQPYAAKLLFVLAGRRLSLQYHTEKAETLCLVEGSAELMLADENDELSVFTMAANVGYTVVPGRRHRLVALTDVVVFEASTPELGTTVRIEDDYHRPDEATGPQPALVD